MPETKFGVACLELSKYIEEKDNEIGNLKKEIENLKNIIDEKNNKIKEFAEKLLGVLEKYKEKNSL